MRIAVIAPGAMGAGIARRLHQHGATVAVTTAGRSAASAARADGLTLMDSEAALAGWAELVLSVMPPAEALGLAQRLAPSLAGRGAIFADCNAVSPDTVRQVQAALPGVDFVDIGIIGLPPKADGPGPRLYAAGKRAAELLALRDHGIDLRVIEGDVGAASALKMSYAGITKGLIALASAMALGATEAGAATALRAELAESQPDMLRTLERSVPDMFGKAYRWVAEMQEISAFLGDNPAAPAYQAAAALYTAIAADVVAPQADGMVARLGAFYRKEPQA